MEVTDPTTRLAYKTYIAERGTESSIDSDYEKSRIHRVPDREIREHPKGSPIGLK